MTDYTDRAGDVLEVDPVPGQDRLGFLAYTEVHLDRAQVRELITELQDWAGPEHLDLPLVDRFPWTGVLIGMALVAAFALGGLLL